MTPLEYKSIRKALKLTQGDLANQLGITREIICKRESGKQRIRKEASLAIQQLQIKAQQA